MEVPALYPKETASQEPDSTGMSSADATPTVVSGSAAPAAVPTLEGRMDISLPLSSVKEQGMVSESSTQLLVPPPLSSSQLDSLEGSASPAAAAVDAVEHGGVAGSAGGSVTHGVATHAVDETM